MQPLFAGIPGSVGTKKKAAPKPKPAFTPPPTWGHVAPRSIVWGPNTVSWQSEPGKYNVWPQPHAHPITTNPAVPSGWIGHRSVVVRRRAAHSEVLARNQTPETETKNQMDTDQALLAMTRKEQVRVSLVSPRAVEVLLTRSNHGEVQFLYRADLLFYRGPNGLVVPVDGRLASWPTGAFYCTASTPCLTDKDPKDFSFVDFVGCPIEGLEANDSYQVFLDLVIKSVRNAKDLSDQDFKRFAAIAAANDWFAGSQTNLTDADKELLRQRVVAAEYPPGPWSEFQDEVRLGTSGLAQDWPKALRDTLW